MPALAPELRPVWAAAAVDGVDVGGVLEIGCSAAVVDGARELKGVAAAAAAAVKMTG